MLALKDSFSFINIKTDVDDFKNQTVSLLQGDKIQPLLRRYEIVALYFDSGILLVDNYNYDHNPEKFHRFITDVTNTGILLNSINIVPDDKLRMLIRSKSVVEDPRDNEIELHESILMYHRLMEQADNYGAQDVYIKCSKSKNIAFVQFKKDDSLIGETMSLRDYNFGMSVCRCIYDGGKSTGDTKGSFDEVSLQEKQIMHTIYDGSGAIKNRLQIRFTKVKTSRIGEIIVNMRLQRGARRLNELGLDSDIYRILHEKIANTKGGIITSGRTGSGKSTTMFAAFLERPRYEKLFTFEDPIEIEVPEEFTNIDQITMDDNVEKQMKAINRMNPDAVFVQEMRDSMSAEFAFGMMLSGIPVLTTCHATSAPGVIERLIELKVPLYNIVADKTVSLIMSQSLVKKVCPSCAESLSELKHSDHYKHSILVEKANKLGLDITDDMLVRSQEGCVECDNTGTIGRKLVIEYIDLTDKDKSYIERKAFTEWRSYLRTTSYNPIEKQCYKLATEHVMCTQDMLEYF